MVIVQLDEKWDGRVVPRSMRLWWDDQHQAMVFLPDSIVIELYWFLVRRQANVFTGFSYGDRSSI